MGARVDAVEGGAHPFLTAHFLTPPLVFVFNPRHSRRPWVHSLLVQKGGGACCFSSVSPLQRERYNDRDPFKRGRSLSSLYIRQCFPSLLPPVRRPRGSVTSTCVHPAIIPRSSQAAQGASTLSFMSTRRVDTRPPPPPPTTGYRDTDPRRVFVLPSPINLHER